MLVGILSDTHNDHLMARAAVRILRREGAEHLIHCGDIGGETVFDELLDYPLTFVWGNTDFPGNGLLAYLETIGLTPPGSAPIKIDLDGKRFAIYHGHEPAFNTATDDADVDVVCHGHTHVARNDSIRGKRIINPGALHRARRKTTAIYDTQTDTVSFIDVPEG